MLIEITQLNNHYFQWKLYDGPDGVEVRRGSTPTIEMAFECILQARERISASYTEAEPAPTPVDYSTYPNSTIFRLRNGGTVVKCGRDITRAYPIRGIHDCATHWWNEQGKSALGSHRDIIGVLWTPDSGIPLESLLEPDNQTLQQLETQEEPQQPADDPWLSPETIHTIKEEFYRTGPHPEYTDADTSPEDEPTFAYPERDPNLRCQTCRWFVPLQRDSGCCKRRAPSPDGFPVLSRLEWCGEHSFHEPS